MKELKCPNCGSMFTVDEADYASIVNQVKNAEFEEELCRRINEMKGRQDAEQKVKDAEAREDFGKKISAKEQEILAKEQEISRLKASLESIEEKNKLEIDKALAAKDLVIAGLQSTIKLSESEKEKAVLVAKEQMKDDLNKKESELAALRSKKDMEIAELMASVEDPGLYVLDYAPNAYADMIDANGETFFRVIRDAHPDVPVIFIEDVIFPHTVFDKEILAEVTLKNEAQKRLFLKLKKAGEKNSRIHESH